MDQQSQLPAEPTAAEVLVRDPLTPVTRKERLYLLAVSLTGIAMVRTGLVPSKIATFGIELDKPNRSALLFLLALVAIYFLVAFILYAASDWNARYEALTAANDRMYNSLRYRDLAYALATSEENVRRLYGGGELAHYIHQRVYGFGSRRDVDRLRERYDGVRFFKLPEMDVLLKQNADPSVREKVAAEAGRSLVRAFENPADEAKVEHPARIRMAATSRVVFEFVLPVLVGVYAIYELLARSLFG